MGKLPACDELKRPKFAYDRLIHDHCPRRAHFDAGRFVHDFGDEAHREGYCLYKMGCKGPATHAGCSTRHFNETPDVWPIGIGAPCVGCTEKSVAFRVPIFQTVDIHNATPPEGYPLVNSQTGSLGAGAAALAGLITGAVGGAAWTTSQKFAKHDEAEITEEDTDVVGKGGK